MSRVAFLPEKFRERIKALLPEDEFTAFEAACARPLRKSIRVNTLKIEVDAFRDSAHHKGWKLTPIPWCEEGFWIDRPLQEQKEAPLGRTWEHAVGLFYIQEASSMLPPEAIFSDKEAPKGVLDMAAAPGSKTTQLAGKMSNAGLLVANEFSASRIKALFSNLERCGVANVALTHFDGAKFGEMASESFDAILLDAPCTGEGIVRKEPAVLENWSERRIAAAAAIQKQLIVSAFKALRPGGTLVYSTCTLAPEENEEVCYFLRERYPDAVSFVSLEQLFPEAKKSLTSEGFLRIWPHTFDTEGFFVAKIHKEKSILLSQKIFHQGKRKEPRKNFPFVLASAEAIQKVKKYYCEHFSWDASFPDHDLWERDREVWLFPKAVSALIGQVKFDRIGIKLCEIHEKGIRSAHETAIIFGKQFQENSIELDPEAAELFVAGNHLPFSPERDLSGEVLCRFDGFALGFARVQDERLKNALPKKIAEQVEFSRGV